MTDQFRPRQNFIEIVNFLLYDELSPAVSIICETIVANICLQDVPNAFRKQFLFVWFLCSSLLALEQERLRDEFFARHSKTTFPGELTNNRYCFT